MNVHRISRIAAAIAVLAQTLPALASEDSPPQPLQRVVVTGSNIKRIDVETSDPVAVLTRADIERSGATTLAGFLQSLPWATSSLTDLGDGEGFAPGASSTSLRHLEQQSTLVLLNGRRVAPFALADFSQYFTNLDTLPLAAIERVDILKNGASAIYGSDAVAGVVNIITRQNYQGFEAGADAGTSLRSHSFGERGFHATAGIGDMDTDGFNLTGTVQYYRRDSVIWRDVLDHASPAWRSTLPQGRDQLSYYSSPGNIASASTPLHAIAGCESSMLSSGVCWYDRYSVLEAQPSAERTNLMVSARAKLAPDIEGFAELLWARTKTAYKWPHPVYDSTDSPLTGVNPKTGTAETFSSFNLPATHPLNDTGESAMLTYRFNDVDAGNAATGKTYRLLTGVKGRASGYDWETSVAFLGSKAVQAMRQPFSKSGFQQMIGGTTDASDPASPIDPNFFNLPGGYRLGQKNSAAVLDALFPVIGYRGALSQTALDGKISGELAALPAGPVSFAAGYDLRHERSVITPSGNVLEGDIVGFASAQTDAARTYGAVFGELEIPVVETLTTQLAARVDKFPGFGAHLSPKLGVRFQPTKSLLLRATAESGFRAPNLVESGASTKAGYQGGVQDPKRCNGAKSYAADLRAQAAALPADSPDATALRAQAEQVFNNECSAGTVAIINSNPALKPEVSHGYSFGMLFEPLQYTSLTVDYWALKRTNEIRDESIDNILAQEGQLAPGLAVRRAPLNQDTTFTSTQLQQQYGITTGALLGVTKQFQNISRTRTDGVDFSAKTRFDTPAGGLELTLLGTWLNRFQAYNTARGGFGDNMAGRNGYSRLSTNLSGALTTGPFVNGLTLAYRSGTKLQGDYYDTAWNAQGCADQGLSARECRVGAYVRTDYFLSYSAPHNVTVSANVRNLFDRSIAFSRRAAGEMPPLEDVQGRSLHIAVNYKFF